MKVRLTSQRWFHALAVMVLLTLLGSACGPTPSSTPEPTISTPEAQPTEPLVMIDMSSLVFFSTQFAPVEEQEKFRAILKDGGFDFTSSEEGPLLDLMTAEAQAT